MNKIGYLATIIASFVLVSCSKKFPVNESAKVLILNPNNDDLDLHINNEFVRDVTKKVGHVYLNQGDFNFSIIKDGKTENEVIIEIDSDEADRSSFDNEHVKLVNSNLTNDYVLVDCSAAYSEDENAAYTIKEKYIDQPSIQLEYISYQYFRMGWEKLPNNLSGYGDLTIYKLFYIPEEYTTKSDEEILKYCATQGLYE